MITNVHRMIINEHKFVSDGIMMVTTMMRMILMVLMLMNH